MVFAGRKRKREVAAAMTVQTVWVVRMHRKEESMRFDPGQMVT